MIPPTARRRRELRWSNLGAPSESERRRDASIRQIPEHIVSGRARGRDVTHHVDEPRPTTFHRGDTLLEKRESLAQDFREPLGGDGAIGVPQKQNFLDVADGEAAILELTDEADAIERARVVDSLPALRAPGFTEQS